MHVPKAAASHLPVVAPPGSGRGALKIAEDSGALSGGGGPEAVFVFFLENGGSRVAVGIVDKKCKGFEV
jgi:hypothetical protein